MHRIVSLILGLKIKVQKADLSHWNLLKGVELLFSGLGSSFLLELIMTPHKFSTSNCGIIMFATQNSVLPVPPLFPTGGALTLGQKLTQFWMK